MVKALPKEEEWRIDDAIEVRKKCLEAILKYDEESTTELE